MSRGSRYIWVNIYIYRKREREVVYIESPGTITNPKFANRFKLIEKKLRALSKYLPTPLPVTHSLWAGRSAVTIPVVATDFLSSTPVQTNPGANKMGTKGSGALSRQ
jgi:hypothetical protein